MSASSAPSPLTLFLYGRETCHLCHDMWADIQVLAQKNHHSLHLVWQDIEDNAELESRYGLRIPVLTDDCEQLISEGRLDVDKLLRHITDHS
jgi:thioredoxin reductase (NADPH)